MKSSDRTSALAIIWGAFAVASIFTLGGDPLNPFSLALGTLYVGAAVLATLFVTRSKAEFSREELTHLIQQINAGEKQKRDSASSRIDRLIAEMDEGELEALRRRLNDELPYETASDGEIASLEELVRRRGGRGQQ